MIQIICHEAPANVRITADDAFDWPYEMAVLVGAADTIVSSFANKMTDTHRELFDISVPVVTIPK